MIIQMKFLGFRPFYKEKNSKTKSYIVSEKKELFLSQITSVELKKIHIHPSDTRVKILQRKRLSCVIKMT